MPTYEYKCKGCGCRFEVFQRMTDEPLATCRQCGGPLKRLIGAGAGIIFKGSGFYCTDYRSSSYTKDAGKEKSAASTESSTGTSSSDSTRKSDD